jgi:hypothetical protein
LRLAGVTACLCEVSFPVSQSGRPRPLAGGQSPTAIACADAQAVAIFRAIGFLATINVILLFPDFGETFARLAMLA